MTVLLEMFSFPSPANPHPITEIPSNITHEEGRGWEAVCNIDLTGDAIFWSWASTRTRPWGGAHSFFYQSAASLDGGGGGGGGDDEDSDTFFSDLKIWGSIFQTQSLTSKQTHTKGVHSTRELTKRVLVSIINHTTPKSWRDIYISFLSPPPPPIDAHASGSLVSSIV